jgi:hypothetical protein
MTTNPSTGTGIGVYDKDLLTAINAQAELMKDPLKGYESRVILSQFLQRIELTDEDPGVNLTRLSQGRVVSRIPKGGPYQGYSPVYPASSSSQLRSAEGTIIILKTYWA